MPLVLDKRGMMRRVHNSPLMGWQVAKHGVCIDLCQVTYLMDTSSIL